MDREVAAIIAERDAGLNTLRVLSSRWSMVKTRRYHEDQILLLIHPPADLPALDWDMILPQGRQIRISNEITFTTNNARSHKTEFQFRGEETPSWIALVTHLTEAPICAVLQNEADFDNALFREQLQERAFIEPDFSDPTAERAEQAVISAGLVHEDDQLTDTLLRLRMTDGRRVSPVGQFTNIYLRNQRLTKSDVFNKGSYTVDFNGMLSLANPAQRQCIQAVHDEPVSIIHGPPGTAKTSTLVFIAESILTRFPNARIIITAPSNAATDRVAQSMSNRQRHTGFIFNHARLMSTAMAEVDIHQNPHNQLNDCLFHTLCYNWARAYRGPDREYGDFINGFNQIRVEGNLTSKTARKHFNSQRKNAAREVIQGINVIITTSVSSGLRWLVDNFKPRYFLSDEYGSAQTYLSMITLMSFRDSIDHVVFAGDWKQLGPFYQTSEGARAWATTHLQKLVEDGHPCVQLNVNYRTHRALCLHTASIFYRNNLTAARENLGPWGDRLLHELRGSNIVDADGKKTELTSTAHFLNVRNSTFVTNENGSSYSREEESCIAALNTILLSTGACDIHHILIMTGFRAQNKNIQRLAKEGGWSAKNLEATAWVTTVQAAQGSERKITILGLTKSGEALRYSSIVGSSFVNVATSRMNDFIYVVGSWAAVERLPVGDWLRITMMSLRENILNFVLNVGNAPFSFEHEIPIAAGRPRHELQRQFVDVGREFHARQQLTSLRHSLANLYILLDSPADADIAKELKLYTMALGRVKYFRKLGGLDWAAVWLDDWTRPELADENDLLGLEQQAAEKRCVFRWRWAAAAVRLSTFRRDVVDVEINLRANRAEMKEQMRRSRALRERGYKAEDEDGPTPID